MSIRELSPAEAHALLGREEGAVYLDVRTEPEFSAGHPAGARNVPVVFLEGGAPTPNPEFVAIVGRLVPRDVTLVVGCQSGMRSLRACELLAQAGFTSLVNVRAGFGGARDRTGRVVEPGWADAGLPVEQGQPAGASWADLKQRG